MHELVSKIEGRSRGSTWLQGLDRTRAAAGEPQKAVDWGQAKM